jgi:hypothetical protein
MLPIRSALRERGLDPQATGIIPVDAILDAAQEPARPATPAVGRKLLR